jgi:hypothetical protein
MTISTHGIAERLAELPTRKEIAPQEIQRFYRYPPCKHHRVLGVLCH